MSRSREDLLAEAERALARGWVLIPTCHLRKIPARPWRDRAPFDLLTLSRAVRYGGCGIAVRTGSPRGYRDHPCGGGSGIVIIDVDPGHGGLVDPAWPTTWTVATPSGGSHRYYAWTGEDVIPSVAGALGPGVDVRGRGGIALLPETPMAHGTYRWSIGPDDAPLAPLPHPLVEQLREDPRPPPRSVLPPECAAQRIASGKFDRYTEVALRGALEAIASTPPGDRNETLYKNAYRVARFVAAGLLAEEDARYLLADAGRATGLHDREVQRTIRSAFAGGLSNPIDLAAVQAKSRTRHRRSRR
jgi:hypothetical protein